MLPHGLRQGESGVSREDNPATWLLESGLERLPAPAGELIEGPINIVPNVPALGEVLIPKPAGPPFDKALIDVLNEAAESLDFLGVTFQPIEERACKLKNGIGLRIDGNALGGFAKLILGGVNCRL